MKPKKAKKKENNPGRMSHSFTVPDTSEHPFRVFREI